MSSAIALRLPSRRWVIGIGLVLILAVISYTGYRFYSAAHSLNGAGIGDLIGLAQNQDDQPGTLAYKIHHGERVNILLMGYGGADHDGSYLADSIMVISVKGTDRVALTSIPRDTYVKVAAFANGGSYDGKINAAYAIPMSRGAFGKLKPEYSDDFNGAGKLASRVIGDYLGQNIDYWVGVDFTAFKKTVDAVDGVDVDNPSVLDDYEYPTENYGYKHIHFDAGRLHLNGDQALIYARERHADSDFGRSKRQQVLAAAIKDKALSVGAVPKLYDLLGALQDNVHTNLSLNDLKVFGGVADKINSAETHKVSIDNTNWQYDTSDPSAGYILLARDKTMASLRRYIDNELPDPAVLAEKAYVQFASTSGQASQGQNLAGVQAVVMKMIGFQAMPPQAGTTAPAVTEIHDYSGGKASRTAKWMADYFKGTVVTEDPGSRPSPPPPLAPSPGASPVPFAAPDIVVVLGKDYSAAYDQLERPVYTPPPGYNNNTRLNPTPVAPKPTPTPTVEPTITPTPRSSPLPVPSPTPCPVGHICG